MEKPGIVFLPGAGLGSRIWDKMPPLLNTGCLAVEYPGRKPGEGPNKLRSLDDYCDHVIQQISGWGKDRLIIVAHSIGGVPGLKIASHFGSKVVGFAALSAVVPINGGSFLSALPLPQRILLSVMMGIAGTKPPVAVIEKSLCSDLSPEESFRIVRDFVPESVRLYSDKCEAPVPHTERIYIKLNRDKELPVSMQDKMIKNLDTPWVVTIESGHLPMISHPSELAAVLNQFSDFCCK